MDDVEDDSVLRRGIPVAHKIYGIPQTINSANYVYFLAYQELFKFRRREEGANMDEDGGSTGSGKGKGKARAGAKGLDEIITEELLTLHRGQGLDLFWRDSLTCPTEEEYIHMVLGKTGGLFRIAIKLMMDRSESDVDYVPLVNLISIYFQIRDDYMNLQSTEYAGNKGFAEDLTEGKFSFPVVHAVRAEKGSREILNILQKRTDSHSLKAHAVHIMRTRTHSFAYCRTVLATLDAQIRAEIERLGGNPALVRIVDALGIGEGEGGRDGPVK